MRISALALVLLFVGCSSKSTPNADAGVDLSTNTTDGSVLLDASVVDEGDVDASVVDESVVDESVIVDQAAPPPALSLSVTTPLAFGTTNVSLPDAILNAVYAQSVTPVGGVSPYHVTVTGASLTGVTVLPTSNDSASAAAAFAGTPSASGEVDTHAMLTITATDAASQSASAVYDVRLIAPAPAITPTTLANGRGGVAYSTTVAATGGTGTLTWSDPTTTLPGGLSISTAGAVTGTPTGAAAALNTGAYTVMLKISDALTDRVTNAATPRTATKSLTQTIDLGYRVNVLPLIVTTYSCTGCHSGGSVVPDFSGGKVAGSEDATKLINVLSGGTVPFGSSACGGGAALNYVKPGDKTQSLLYLKVSGTTAAPPPCGTCMPYSGTCGAMPTMVANDLATLQRWITSIPASPGVNDFK